MTNPNEADIRELIAYTIDVWKFQTNEFITVEVMESLRGASIEEGLVEWLYPETEVLPPGVERTLQVTVAGKVMTFDIYEPAAK